MKSVNAYFYMKRDTPLPLYASVNILDDLPSIPLVTYILNEWPISQPKELVSYSLDWGYFCKQKALLSC